MLPFYNAFGCSAAPLRTGQRTCPTPMATPVCFLSSSSKLWDFLRLRSPNIALLIGLVIPRLQSLPGPLVSRQRCHSNLFLATRCCGVLFSHADVHLPPDPSETVESASSTPTSQYNARVEFRWNKESHVNCGEDIRLFSTHISNLVDSMMTT